MPAASRPWLPAAALAAAAFAVVSLTARSQPRLPPPDPPAGEADVRKLGAKGDGVADDTAAVQAAVDAGVGVVRFPKGTYRLTRTVTVDLARVGWTALRGDGVARLVMAGAGPAVKFVGTHAGTAAPNTVKEPVWERERMPSADGLEVVGEHAEADGFEATGTMQLTLTRLLVRRCRHAVHLTGRNRNVTLADSHLYQNRGVGVFLDNVNLHQMNVTNCHVSYNLRGGVVCLGGQVRNLHVAGCDVEANHDPNGPPSANVDVDSTGGSNAEVAVTGCTIQHTRTAAGSVNVRVKGPTTRDAGTDEVRDGHVTISGNVMSDTRVNVHLLHARGVVVTGNTLWTGVEHNILAEHSANVVVGPNNLDRNPRYHREEDGSNNAVLFRDCSDCSVTGLTLRGTRRAAAGLTLERCDRFNVSGCSVLDCDNVAVQLTDVTRSMLTGCLIRDDRPDAASKSIVAAGGRANVIADNVINRPAEVAAGVGVVSRNLDPK